MTDGGDPDDLWAPTRPEHAAGNPPPPPPPPPGGAVYEPPVEPNVEPTLVAPVVGAAGAAGAAGGPPPPAPPGDEPPGGDGPGEGRPPWLIPAAVALAFLLLIGLVLALALGGGDDDTVDSGATSSSVPPESATTSTAPATTTTDETTTTTDETTTTTTATTVAPTDPPVTEPPPTEPPPTEPPPTEPPPSVPDPGFATVGSETVPIESHCFVVPFEPNTGDYQVTSLLVDTTEGLVMIDRWFDEGGAQGVDVWFVDADERGEGTDIREFDGGFAATVDIGGRSVQVAASPIPPGDDECRGDAVTDREPDFAFAARQLVHAVCVVETDTYAALLTEQSQMILARGSAADGEPAPAQVAWVPPREDEAFTSTDGSWSDDGDIAEIEARLVRDDETRVFRSTIDLSDATDCE